MSKSIKKLLSCLLVVAMIVGFVPAFTVDASAASSPLVEFEYENETITVYAADETQYFAAGSVTSSAEGTFVVNFTEPGDHELKVKSGSFKLSSVTAIGGGGGGGAAGGMWASSGFVSNNWNAQSVGLGGAGGEIKTVEVSATISAGELLSASVGEGGTGGKAKNSDCFTGYITIGSNIGGYDTEGKNVSVTAAPTNGYYSVEYVGYQCCDDDLTNTNFTRDKGTNGGETTVKVGASTILTAAGGAAEGGASPSTPMAWGNGVNGTAATATQAASGGSGACTYQNGQWASWDWGDDGFETGSGNVNGSSWSCWLCGEDYSPVDPSHSASIPAGATARAVVNGSRMVGGTGGIGNELTSGNAGSGGSPGNEHNCGGFNIYSNRGTDATGYGNGGGGGALSTVRYGIWRFGHNASTGSTILGRLAGSGGNGASGLVSIVGKAEILGSLRIIKDSSDNIKEGFVFNVKCAANGYDQDFTTPAGGEIIVDNLAAGEYIVTEKLPTGSAYKAYAGSSVKDDSKAGDAITVTVSTGTEAVVNFYNEYLPGALTIKKYSSDNNKEGFVFNVKCVALGYDKDFTTPADGVIRIEGLAGGEYVVTEKLPSNTVYKPYAGTASKDESKAGNSVTVTVNYCAETVTSFYNELLTGSLTIQKNSEDGTKYREGKRFSVTVISDGPYKGWSKPAVTDANGIATFNNLPIGTYRIDEDEYDNYIAYSDTVTITNGNETVKPVTNITRKGGITIYKQDAVSGNAAQGDGKLAGAEFEIINKSGKTINYNGAKFDDGASLGTIATDENGVATTGELAISTGTYLIREFSAPEGYLVNSGWEKTITLTEQGEMYTLDADEACKDTIISGGVKLQKLDDENGTKQGDASLEGAEFSIINKSVNPVFVNGKSYAQGEVVMTITTDENGIASSEEKVLPYGKYEITEIKPPVGYKISSQVISFSITKDGEMVELMSENKAVKETVIRGGISVQKYDAERMESAAANTNASLSGANIQIVNKSAAPIVFNGKEIGVNEVVTTIVTDENGFASTEANALPYGTYELTETKAPNGYLVNKDWKVTVKIRDNTIVAVDGDDALIDYLIRNDLSFNKINGKTSERIPYAVFKLTSNATDESHIIVCDINGMFDSSQLENDKNTNMNDAALNADGTVDETKLDPTAGVWFSDPNNATNAINSIGAFPCGKYTFQELRTSANEGLRLVQFKIDIYQAAETVHIGTVDDNPLPAIQTVLVNKALDEHIAAPDEKCTFIDTVYYTGVLAGASYKVEGVLMDKETGNAILDADGNEVTASTQFTAKGESGTVQLKFVFDASGMEGKSIVAFETMTAIKKDDTVAEHKELNDENQTVHIPKVSTTAGDEYGRRSIMAKDSVTIIDTVEYSNLLAGKEYTLSGVLMNKETGNPVKIDGKEVKAIVTFVAEKESGAVEIPFTFNASGLEGYSVVVFEELSFAGKIIAEHKDIDDEAQTVSFPFIDTSAADENGSKYLSGADEMTVIDTVNYKNLVPNTEYKLEGTLMDKTTGNAAVDMDGNAIKASVVFTPDSADGKVELRFVFKPGADSGVYVVFETLYEGEAIRAEHTDIDDADQTVYAPAIKTSAAAKDSTKIIEATKVVTVVDTVTYSGLKTGEKYLLVGTLMDKETGNAVLDDAGKPILATKQFTPSESSGVAEVEFKFNGVELGGKMFVVFEELQTGGTVVAEHKDLEDEAQTIELIYSGKLRKIDASTEEPLAGVEIIIKDLTDRTERTVITDENGFAYFALVKGHKYSYQEMTALDGYDLDNNVYEFTVSKSEEDEPFETIEFRNVRTGTIVLSKTDVISGDPVMGAEITVYDSEGKAIFVQKTDKYGRIYFFPDGKTGRFTFRETKAPEGYYLNEDIYAFEIDVNGGVTKITGTTKFTDAPYGVVVIKKTDTNGAPLAGAVLAIYDETGKKIGTGKTGETGRIYFVAPTFGKYYFVEEQAPQGYLKTDKQFYFEIDSNYKITGTTSITNEKSGIPTGDIDPSIYGILAVASVLCAGAAIFIYKKKQRTE